MILLDTHVLIWLIEGDVRLGHRTRRVIDRERSGNGAQIAAISIWETAMLADKNKVVLSRSPTQWFDAVLSAPGFKLAPISPAIAIDAGSLPGDIHGDPADRLIIATARSFGCPIATADRKILTYAAAGHLQVVDARR